MNGFDAEAWQGDAAVAVADEALVGGTLTNSRPEVGNYCNGVGCCTATLISPMFFITAAHCTGYQAIMMGGTLNLDAAGVVVPVNRVFAFSGNPAKWVSRGCPQSQHPDCSNGAGPMDIALGQLTAPVSGTAATPAQIATRPPNVGEQVLQYGYGCGSRSPNNNWARRNILYNWPNTLAGCPGDSGGPVFLGATGPIAAIASAADGITPDTFADPVRFKLRIEQMMRDLGGGLELDTNRNGFDLPNNTTAPSAADCRLRCSSTEACRAFSWVQSTQMCFLKRAAPEPTSAIGVISGMPIQGDKFNLFGSDYGDSEQPNYLACAGACGRDGALCKAWSYVGSTKRCWLKSAVPAPDFVGCPSCISGIQRRSDVGVNRFGNDLFSITTPINAGGCAFSCAAQPRCQGYAFRISPRTCWFKTVPPAPSLVGNDIASGVRRGMVYNTSLSGTTFSDIPMDAPRPEECAATCQNVLGCVAWTLVTENSDGSNRCLLKASVGNVSSAFGAVSGLRGVDFL